MGATLPYPDKPANGQAPDATPILANLLALLSAINGFDASQVLPGTIVESAFANSVNPRLRDGGWMAPFIESGGWTASFSTLSWTMPSGVAWYAGYRSPFTGATFTVSINSDTYYSVTQAGALNAAQAVANGAAVPTLAATSQWLAKVVSGASAIGSIQDMRNLSPIGFGNFVKTYTPAVGTVTGGAVVTGSPSFYINLGGLKIAWVCVACNNTSAGTNYHVTGVTLPVGFFNSIQAWFPTIASVGNAANQHLSGDGIFVSPANFQFYIDNSTNVSSCSVNALVIGT